MGCWGKMGEFLLTKVPSLVIHRLAVPVAVDVDEDKGDIWCGTVPDHASSQDHCHLLQLPLELVLLITDQLDLNSLYTLTHCCWLLHRLLHAEVTTRFRRTLAPWANTPLLCAGDEMYSNPPGITTQIPKDFCPDPEIEEEITPGKYGNLTVFDVMQHIHPINVLSPSASLSLPTVNTVSYTPYYNFNLRPPNHWRSILKIKKYFPPERHWMLRNHTTKEYVYAHVLTSRDGTGGGLDRPDAKDVWGYTLGTLVVMNTCWSDSENTAMFGLDVRGRWAGHCFDIVEEARLLQDMKAGEVWVDVSYREYEAMVHLFKQNGWEEE